MLASIYTIRRGLCATVCAVFNTVYKFSMAHACLLHVYRLGLKSMSNNLLGGCVQMRTDLALKVNLIYLDSIDIPVLREPIFVSLCPECAKLELKVQVDI